MNILVDEVMGTHSFGIQIEGQATAIAIASLMLTFDNT